MRRTGKTNTLAIWLWCGGILAIGQLAKAGDVTPGDQQLPTVVVSAPRIAKSPSGSVLKGEALNTQAATTSDAAHLLQDVPGVSLYGAGGVSSLPVIHGMADDRLNVQVDGESLMSACPNHMNSPLSYISPTRVAKAEVFTGITPVSIGGDSIGGSVRVNSAAPEFAIAGEGVLTKGEFGTFYRSNGNAYGANLGATLAGEDYNITYSGSTAQAGDYRAAKDFKASGPSGNGWLNGNVVGSSRYKSENQSLGVAVRRDNHLLEFKVDVQDIPYEGFPNQRMDLTKNNNTNVSLRYTGEYQWGTLEASAYHQKTEHEMNFGSDKQFWYPGSSGGVSINAPGMPMNAEGKTTGASIKGDILLSDRDTLRLGGEFQSYRLNDWWPPSPSVLPANWPMKDGNGVAVAGMAPYTFQNINNGKRDRLGVFGEWEARWNPQWLTLLGVRTENVTTDTGNVQGYNTMMMSQKPDSTAFNAAGHQRTDQNWDLTTLSRYTPNSTQSYEFGYAQKTRSPNLYERYPWSTASMMTIMNNFVGDGNGYVGNLNLKPEVAHTLSVTADLHDATKEQWGLKATPYYTYVHNYIDAERCPVGTNCYSVANSTTTNQYVKLQYVNQTAELYGIDVSGHQSLGNLADYGSFTATGLLNYTKGKNDTTHGHLYNIMPLNAKVALVQHKDAWTNTFEAQMVAGKKDVSQVRNEVPTGGYTLFNLRSSYAWGKKARVDIGVENLFDRYYASPLGGAYVGQGMTMGINSIPWGVAVPGFGRSIYTALNVRF